MVMLPDYTTPRRVRIDLCAQPTAMLVMSLTPQATLPHANDVCQHRVPSVRFLSPCRRSYRKTYTEHAAAYVFQYDRRKQSGKRTLRANHLTKPRYWNFARYGSIVFMRFEPVVPVNTGTSVTGTGWVVVRPATGPSGEYSRGLSCRMPMASTRPG